MSLSEAVPEMSRLKEERFAPVLVCGLSALLLPAKSDEAEH